MSLEANLRRMIIGQDEAIEQIVNIYQMHLTGMSAPGGLSEISYSWARPVPARLALWKLPPRRS